MPDIQFDPDPDDAYRSVPLVVAQWVDTVLDELEQDPGAAHLRKHRFTSVDAWGVLRRFRDDEFLLLWRREEETIIVVYLGPPPA